MRLQRFYIKEKVDEQKAITLSDTDLIHQIVNVFRLKDGNQVIVFDGSGFEYLCEIVSQTKKELELKVLEGVDKSVKQNTKVSLYLALIKKGNFELAVEKCTEVGVDKICPIVSERSEKKDLNIERLGKIVKEASEQSGRVVLPEVYNITGLEEAVSQAVKENKRCVVFHTGVSSTHHLPSQTQDSSLNKEEKGNVAIFIGCEGGWTEKELELFKKNNFQFSSLGQNILRAETAAIVSSALFLIL
jgi:16S rRNA (uracil1498-N3)-methyltransferase